MLLTVQYCLSMLICFDPLQPIIAAEPGDEQAADASDATSSVTAPSDDDGMLSCDGHLTDRS
jgi:hypothetical protein